MDEDHLDIAPYQMVLNEEYGTNFETNQTLSLPLPEEFDLDSFISQYTGITKQQQLLFLVENCPLLTLSAGRLLLEEIKLNTFNINLFNHILQLILSAGNEQLDTSNWYQETKNYLKVQNELLLNNLRKCKANMIKESTRLTLIELGDFLSKTGELGNGVGYYLKARDHGSTDQHVLQVSIKAITLLLGHGQYAQASSLNSRLEGFEPLDAQYVTFRNAARGLADFSFSKFREAATKLLLVEHQYLDLVTPFLSGYDLAMMIGLSSLAIMDRSDLKQFVMSNPSYRKILEYAPQMKQILQQLIKLQYSKAIDLLAQLKPTLNLIKHLQPQLSKLYQLIQNQLIIQFIKPYKSVTFSHMSNQLNCSNEQIQQSVLDLIQKQKLNVVLDLHNQCVIHQPKDQRAIAISKILNLDQTLNRTIRTTLTHHALQNVKFKKSKPTN